MSWLQDTGILSKLKNDALPRGKSGVKSPKLRHDVALSVGHLGTPLIIQAVGIALALLAFCVELISAKKKKKRTQRRPRHRQVASNGNSIAMIRIS